MKNKICTFFIVTILFASPAIGGNCMEELNALAPVLTSADNGLTSENMQLAFTLFDEGRDLCENSDETGAAAVIAELKPLLQIIP